MQSDTLDGQLRIKFTMVAGRNLAPNLFALITGCELEVAKKQCLEAHGFLEEALKRYYSLDNAHMQDISSSQIASLMNAIGEDGNAPATYEVSLPALMSIRNDPRSCLLLSFFFAAPRSDVREAIMELGMFLAFESTQEYEAQISDQADVKARLAKFQADSHQAVETFETLGRKEKELHAALLQMCAVQSAVDSGSGPGQADSYALLPCLQGTARVLGLVALSHMYALMRELQEGGRQPVDPEELVLLLASQYLGSESAGTMKHVRQHLRSYWREYLAQSNKDELQIPQQLYDPGSDRLGARPYRSHLSVRVFRIAVPPHRAGRCIGPTGLDLRRQFHMLAVAVGRDFNMIPSKVLLQGDELWFGFEHGFLDSAETHLRAFLGLECEFAVLQSCQLPLFQVRVPFSWVGDGTKTLEALALRKVHGINVIGILKQDGKLYWFPGPNQDIGEDDRILLPSWGIEYFLTPIHKRSYMSDTKYIDIANRGLKEFREFRRFQRDAGGDEDDEDKAFERLVLLPAQMALLTPEQLELGDAEHAIWQRCAPAVISMSFSELADKCLDMHRLETRGVLSKWDLEFLREENNNDRVDPSYMRHMNSSRASSSFSSGGYPGAP
eukprot:TRINITY_DN13740_c0_g1_i2.p1 TRINITY_DN13740_c0_g1~~TRINITY_DN13740_c0_g1_i2.p1  ORF type:complete len:613 (-),score=81.26 TRINITY_DN13740_c0_g1_i2:101-1939(-)